MNSVNTTRVCRNVRDIVRAIRSGPEARRSLARRYVYALLGHLVPYVGMEGDHGLVFAGTRDRTVGRSVFVDGDWAGDDLPRALALAGVDLTNACFVEIGANIGTTTLQAAGLAQRVVAFEPEPTNFRLLRANIAVNDLNDVVTCVNAGCSDSTGRSFMTRDAVNWGDHRVSHTGGDVAVELVRLDDALEAAGVQPGEVGFLWIDVQGHEASVLVGAERLLEAAPPLLIEFWPAVLGASVSTIERIVTASYGQVIDMNTGRPTSVAEARERWQHGITDLLCRR